jgi:hypothetical protein
MRLLLQPSFIRPASRDVPSSNYSLTTGNRSWTQHSLFLQKRGDCFGSTKESRLIPSPSDCFHSIATDLFAADVAAVVQGRWSCVWQCSCSTPWGASAQPLVVLADCAVSGYGFWWGVCGSSRSSRALQLRNNSDTWRRPV